MTLSIRIFVYKLKHQNTMRNILFVSIFFSFFLSAVNAQTDSTNVGSVINPRSQVRWSNEYKEPSNTEIQKIIGTEGGGFYTLRQRQGGIFGNGDVHPVIEHYDANLKLVKAQELDLTYKGKERNLKDVTMLGGKMWLLSYFYNQKLEKTFLFAQQIKKGTLTLDDNLIKVGEQTGSNRNLADVFSFQISKDSSKIVVFNQQPNEKNQQSFTINVYDSDFNEMWVKNAKLPYNRNKFDVHETLVDKSGNVYLLGIVYYDSKTRLIKDGKPTYQYDLVAYVRDSTLDAQEYKIDLKDKFVSNLTFRSNEENDLVFCGFYSEKNAEGIKGSCFFKINPKAKDMTSVSTREFDFGFVTANFSDRDKTRAKDAIAKNNVSREPELANYNLDKLILRSDGGAILVAEQYVVEQRYRNNYPYSPFGSTFYNPYAYNSWGYRSLYSPYGYGYNNGRADYYFNYNDIIVVNIRPDGEIAWTARIPKRQVSVNDNGTYSSYAMSVVSDKMYFVFNDDARNFNPKRTKIYQETPDKSSVVALAEVNRDGQVKVSPLFGNKDQGITTRPKICRQISRNNMAIYGESGRSYRFADLNLNLTE